MYPEMLARVRKTAKEEGSTITGLIERAISENLGNKETLALHFNGVWGF